MSPWTLKTFQDHGPVIDRLIDGQLSRPRAETKAELFARAAVALATAGVDQTSPVVACCVPGRVEVLGKHTDYAGGRSLVAALELGFCLVAVERPDHQITVTDGATGESVGFSMEPELLPRAGHWSNYPMTVARRIAQNFPGPLCGADIAFVSDLPAAAGMSSSSAMMVAMFLALSAVNRLPQHEVYRQNIHEREDLAGYLGTVENGQSYGTLAGDRGVGTFGGSEDHTAILCARPGQMSQYSYCPVRFERSIRLPDGYTFVFATSGVVSEKTGSAMAKYNRASSLAAAVVEEWRHATGRSDPHLAAALASSPDAPEQIPPIAWPGPGWTFPPSELLDRFEQFYAESEQIIPGVPDTLDGPALIQLGQLVDRSQSLGARRLKNQIPETVFLADAARRLGAVGASAFGAGFGGSVWALVGTSQAAEFCTHWAREYAASFPEQSERATFEICGAGPAAFFLSGPDCFA